LLCAQEKEKKRFFFPERQNIPINRYIMKFVINILLNKTESVHWISNLAGSPNKLVGDC